MSDATPSPRFFRVGNTLINLAQVIQIAMLPGKPASAGEVHIRTTNGTYIFEGDDAKLLRATFNSISFDIDHVIPMARFAAEAGA